MAWWQAVLVFLAALVVMALSRLFVQRIVVHDYERGILYRRGRLARILEVGVYWLIRPIHSVRVVDMRSRVATVAGQEILTADNIAVKVSIALRYRVTAPQAAIERSESFTDALYLEGQLVLRDLVSRLPAEELMEHRRELGEQLREMLEVKAQALGLTLDTAGIKDITFPTPVKQIFSQVVEARKAAQAALERARGETATLRHLANAARLLQGNPALVTMKTFQALGSGKHTLILGVPQPVVPVPASQESPPAETPLIQAPETPSLGENLEP